MHTTFLYVKSRDCLCFQNLRLRLPNDTQKTKKDETPPFANTQRKKKGIPPCPAHPVIGSTSFYNIMLEDTYGICVDDRMYILNLHPEKYVGTECVAETYGSG